MTYIVRLVDGDPDTWKLEAPDGTVLSDGNSLPVTTPDDIINDVEADSGSVAPIYREEYEVIDER